MRPTGATSWSVPDWLRSRPTATRIIHLENSPPHLSGQTPSVPAAARGISRFDAGRRRAAREIVTTSSCAAKPDWPQRGDAKDAHEADASFPHASTRLIRSQILAKPTPPRRKKGLQAALTLHKHDASNENVIEVEVHHRTLGFIRSALVRREKASRKGG